MTKPVVTRAGSYGSAEAETQAALEEVSEEIGLNEEPVKRKIPAEKTKNSQDPKEEPVELSPIDHWRKRLAEVGITEEEAEVISDTILRQGYWEKEFSLLPKGKLKMTLRTRDAYHRIRLANALGNTLGADARFETQVRFELAASVAKFAGTTLPHPPTEAEAKEQDDAFIERLTFIDNKIPDPLQDAVRNALGKFNKIVFATLTEGAIEGF